MKFIIIFITIALMGIFYKVIIRLFFELLDVVFHYGVVDRIAQLPSEKEEEKAAYHEFKNGILKTIQDHEKMFPQCHFKFKEQEGCTEIGEELAITVYAMVEEALDNIVSFSAATQATIAIQKDETNHLVVSIEDNGRGFDAHVNPLGKGLEKMKKNIMEAQGVLEIQSAPGQGTLVRAQFPNP